MDSGNSTVKTPEPESETPTRITNGLLKRHPPPPFTYKECLKNHAAALGAHALDGCGEFMPSPSSDPTSLKCAACGCHRNFHRRDPEEPAPDPPSAVPALEYQPHHRHHPPRVNSGSSPNDSPSPPPISSSYYPSAPHMLLALSHNTTTPMSVPAAAIPSSSSRKRFRTKFSPYQKEKMLEISDRVGWKMQKRDEDVINGMCNEIGVDRGVFKVWMHNNKNTLGKKENQASPPAIAGAAAGGGAIGNGAYRNVDLQVQETSRAHRDHLHGNTTTDALGTNGSPSLS